LFLTAKNNLGKDPGHRVSDISVPEKILQRARIDALVR